MIYKLVCNGVNDFPKVYRKDFDEVIIAVDGGFKTIKAMSLKCDYFFGDLDSLTEEDVSGINNKFLYNPVKDKTDFEIAIEFVLNIYKEDDEIIIYNATGGRLDHYEGVLRLLKMYKDKKIIVVNESNKIFIKYTNCLKTFELEKDNKYKYVSFFNIEKNTVLSLTGFKYNLQNYEMKDNDRLCISNEIETTGVVECNKSLLIILSK